MTHGTERSILSQCAPTLAGVKMGSLVKFDSEVCDSALGILASYESMDVGTKILRSVGSYLCLVYNREMLTHSLSDDNVRSFLVSVGYPQDLTVSGALDILAERMSIGIPHEVGIFLGYPLCARYGCGSGLILTNFYITVFERWISNIYILRIIGLYTSTNPKNIVSNLAGRSLHGCE